MSSNNTGIAHAAAVVTAPEIALSGNGLDIRDGDSTPSEFDWTNFGSISRGSLPATRTFIVRNIGTKTLTTSGLVVPTGFTLVEPLATSIAPNSSDTFSVRLDTNSVGTKTGDIRFTTNDADEGSFNFRVSGVVTAATPEVAVLGNNANIADGDTSAESADGTNFGSFSQGASAVTRSFTVKNSGTGTLTTSGLVVPTGFTLVEPLATSIAPNSSDTFSVRLDTNSVGTKTGDIRFTTNDADEPVFNFSVTGSIQEPTFNAPPTDTAAPSLLYATPSDEGTNITPSSNITLKFSTDIKLGNGFITIKNISLNASNNISIADNSQVSFLKDTITINPSRDFSAGSMYSITASAGIARDSMNKDFLGISPGELNFTVGGVGAKPVLLPFSSDKIHNIQQGMNGTFSHTGVLKWGVDFDFSYGEEVLAVTSGSVVDVRENITDGKSASYANDPSLGSSNIGNFITIKNDDGTYISYMHFQKDSVYVDVGSRVFAGQTIGLIGNTGLRTATHLHINFGTKTIIWGGDNIIANGNDDTTYPNYFNTIGNRSVTSSDDNLTGDNTKDNILSGGGGSDNLSGFSGNDRLFGYGGNDVLNGGSGNDVMTGGAGADVFLYEKKEHGDTQSDGTKSITDFVSGEDKLQFVSPNFGNLAVGTLQSAAFISDTTLSAAKQRMTRASATFLYKTDGGALFFDPDGNGASTEVRIATLGSVQLKSTDIQIVSS